VTSVTATEPTRNGSSRTIPANSPGPSAPHPVMSNEADMSVMTIMPIAPFGMIPNERENNDRENMAGRRRRDPDSCRTTP
jgi:hypothetical protein